MSLAIECTSVGPSLTAKLMRRYDTTYISRWRGSRASLEATGRCHWVSIRTIMPRQATGSHSLKKRKKSARRADPLRIMRTRILAEVFHCTLNKITQKIDQKHRTPSEKQKKQEQQKCSYVYTFFTSTLKEITA
jgi:hypothetical protein